MDGREGRCPEGGGEGPREEGMDRSKRGWPEARGGGPKQEGVARSKRGWQGARVDLRERGGWEKNKNSVPRLSRDFRLRLRLPTPPSPCPYTLHQLSTQLTMLILSSAFPT